MSKDIFEEIYEKYDGRYGDLVQAYVDLYEGKKRPVQYKSLEQQIIELWKSREMDNIVIEVHAEKGECIWKITALLKKR